MFLGCWKVVEDVGGVIKSSTIAQPKWIDVDSSRDGEPGVGADDEDGMDDDKKSAVPSFVSLLL